MRSPRIRPLSRRLAVLLWMLAAPTGAAAQGPVLNDIFQTAIADAAADRHQAAIEGFTTVIDAGADALTDAALGNVHWRRGSAQFAIGNDLEALGDFTRAVELAPDFAIAYYSRGLVHRTFGDEHAAIADFDRAIDLPGNDDAAAFAAKGVSHFNLQDYRAAVENFSRAISLASDRAPYFNLRGASYRNLEQYRRAISDFTEAVRLEPEFALAFLNRGITLARTDDHEAAIADFDEALRLDPDLTEAADLRAASVALSSPPPERSAAADSEPVPRVRPTFTKSGEIDYGDDLSVAANDGACGDGRFAGPGMAPAPLFRNDLFHDAADCRAAYQAGAVFLRNRPVASALPGLGETPGINGRWRHTKGGGLLPPTGEMILPRAAAGEVHAEYTAGRSGGRIVGVLDGHSLAGRWIVTGSTLFETPCERQFEGQTWWGTFELIFDEKFEIFEGTFGACDEPVTSSPWTGRKILPQPPSINAAQ